MRTTTYERRYSMFAPSNTYRVIDSMSGWVGEVARQDDPRKWWASNKTWFGGGDLVQTFRTRREAATALRQIEDGADPSTWGGYLVVDAEQ